MEGRRPKTSNRDNNSYRRRCDRSYSRERSRSRLATRSPSRRRDNSRRRSSSRGNSRDRTLDLILARLTAIETTLPVPPSSDGISPHSNNERHVQLPLPPATSPTYEVTHGTDTPVAVGAAPCTPSAQGVISGQCEDATTRIVGALMALSKVRSQNDFVSPFDPSVHDFDAWSAEVDRAKELNGWDDRECLGRIGGSLRGDAKSWLNEWVTNDRSWSNFKVDFRSLCPRNVDVASILYDVMSTNSDNFVTYAEYARKSLLRLNIVTGLSEDLKVAIIARGIVDPHIKAATTNAKPSTRELVEFLSAFVKPKASSSNAVRSANNLGTNQLHKREFNGNIKCRNCGRIGHFKQHCNRKIHNKSASSQPASASSAIDDRKPAKSCSFCKRNGHTVENCFQKQRSDAASKGKTAEVNFCLGSDPSGQT